LLPFRTRLNVMRDSAAKAWQQSLAGGTTGDAQETWLQRLLLRMRACGSHGAPVPLL
jgi:hypothetical protein